MRVPPRTEPGRSTVESIATQETNKAEQIRTSSPNEKRLPEILCSRQGIESLARGADVHEGWCIELLEDEIDDVVVQP